MKALEHFLDYYISHPELKIIYWASNMQLMIDNDVAYLAAPKLRSREVENHYLRKKWKSIEQINLCTIQYYKSCNIISSIN